MILLALFFQTGLAPIIQRWLQNVVLMKAVILLAFLTRQNMIALVHYWQLIIQALAPEKQDGHRLWEIAIMKIFQVGIMVPHLVAVQQTRMLFQSSHL